MTRWETFTLLCSHLRAGLLGGTPPAPDANTAWELLIEASSNHYVTPSLAFYSRTDSAFPPEIRSYLDAVLTLNGRRNERLLETLARVVAVLNANDIEPVLLKGAAHLVGGLYPSTGFRVLGDLDILVPEGQAKNAAESLEGIGFVAGGPALPANHHHLPMLCDPETQAGVELHLGAVHRRSETIVPTTWFLENTRAFAFRGSRVRLPDATRSAAHSVVHDQLDHEGFERGRVDLRRLLDLAILRARHEHAIDWEEIDRRFVQAGVGHVLASYLHFAEALLGQAAPPLRHAPPPDAIAELRRVVDPGRAIWREVAKVPLAFFAARRRDPLGVLNLLRPGTWRKGIRLMAEARVPKW